MSFTQLEGINHIFSLVGLPPVTDTQTANKNVAIVTDIFERARKRVLRKAWFKFANKTDLSPNGNGQIPVSGYLRVLYPSHLLGRLTERNGFVWDKENDEYYGDVIRDAWVISDIAFSNIDSESWQEYIVHEAAVEFSMRLSDVDANYAELNRLRNRARQQAYNEARINIDGGFQIDRALNGFYR
jgi:hypothetical protein